MGLAAIDPHSRKEHTEIHKIPKFGVNHASFFLMIHRRSQGGGPGVPVPPPL